MKATLDAIPNEQSPISLIACAGFEERTPRAAELINDLGVRLHSALLLTYDGDAHQTSYRRLVAICKALVGSGSDLSEVNAFDFDRIGRWVTHIGTEYLILCDITGLSRIGMFVLLTILKNSGRRFWLLYTEAEQYYPTEPYFIDLLKDDEMNEAFFKLSKYEETEIVYSGNCRVEELPGFGGNHLPNYPLMLIAFLTFKRSRLGAILREYEANVRVLIKSAPVRLDLRWRERAMETINFDLIEDNKNSIFSVETLDWQQTFAFLEGLYRATNNRYRYNFLLAPLGSKMQTIGSWMFATRNREIKVVTSTPARLFPDKYSIGYRTTFLIDDIHDHINIGGA
jgi:hypothetical protein